MQLDPSIGYCKMPSKKNNKKPVSPATRLGSVAVCKIIADGWQIACLTGEAGIFTAFQGGSLQ
jgi:hypothetical protein